MDVIPKKWPKLKHDTHKILFNFDEISVEYAILGNKKPLFYQQNLTDGIEIHHYNTILPILQI